MAVLFANTTGHWYSNTNFGTNVNVPVPTSNVGDTLILIGYGDHPTTGLIGSDTGFPTFTTIQPGTATANGALYSGYRVVNGTEGSTARLKLDGSGSANLSVVIMRLTGAQRINPSLGTGSSSTNSASDGVTISTGSGTAVLFHEGGMTIAALGSITTNAEFYSANVPSGTNLVSANQSNTFLSVVFRENPTEISNHGTLSWNVSKGNKKAHVFHILPDVPWIGIKGNTGSTATIANTTTHRLFNSGRATFLAKANTELHRFGIRIGTSTGSGSERVQIGVYDITSGTANSKLIANTTFSTLTSSQFNTIDITPVALTAGNTYAISYRSNSTATITVYSSYVTTPFTRISSLTGDSPLTAWDFDSGSTGDSRITVWADVRAITEPTPILTDVDGDNTVLAGQQNVTANGSSLSNVANMLIISNTRIAYCTIDSNSSTQLVFDVPSLSSLIASNIKFGNVTFKANTTSGLGLPKLGFAYPTSQYKVHDVTDISKANIAGCIYYGASPAIVVGDQILYSNTSALGYSVTIDGQGFPTIASNTDITDSFTYRVYDVTDSTWGSEGTITVIGSVGNPAAKTLTIRTSNDGIGYAKYPTGNHQSWFLRDKEYAQTRIPVKIIAPRPNAELTANSRYKWAHSDFNYEVPVIVMGGTPPFYFEVTGVAGATIERKAPAHNPGAYSWGVLTIPANTVSSWSSAQTINVNVYDQLSKSSPVANVSWQITKSNSQFIFVDAANGNDSNSGNIASPFKTINGYYKSNKNDTTYAEKTVVYRSGNYVLDRWDSVGTSGYLYWPTGKPRGHIGYPGETAVWDFRTMAANVTSRATYAADLFFFGAQHDWFFGNVSTEGGNHLFQFTYGDDRITFWNVTANGMSVPSWESDNRGVFSTLVPGSGSYEYIGLCDMRVTNANNAAGLNNGGIITYVIDDIALDGIVFSNCNATDSIFLKAQVGNATVTGCSVWNDNYSHSRTLNFYNADGANVYPSKLIQTRYTRVASNSDSSGVLEYGTNQPFGIVYVDRCSVIGKTILNFPSNGSGYIIDSVVVNDLTPKVDADISQNSVLTYSRSGSILDANGNFTSSSKYKTLIGQEVRNIG